MAAPRIVQAPPPHPVDHIFFKYVLPHVNIPIKTELLGGERISCSSKFGVLFVVGDAGLYILDAEEVSGKGGEVRDLHHLVVKEEEEEVPTLVSISHGGEEYLSLDKGRGGGNEFVVIYKMEEFLKTKGTCEPIVELKGSAKVKGIAWNPGENMANLIAILTQDGVLLLVTIKGKNAVEFCSYNGDVRCMCWSPKGKQIVVGKGDGSLVQLKLDCTEAKKIPGPGIGRVPTAVFWSSTTQFLVNYVVDGKDIDVMQLDLAKGAPPNYSGFGDVFVSDKIDSNSKCSFVPLLPWNVVICPSSTINDIIVFGKGVHDNSDNWVLTDLNDNRRAAIPIDSFSVGAAVFYGHEKQVAFTESEIYHKMPVLFVLSNTGLLSAFSIINSRVDAPSVFQKVPCPLPLPPGLLTVGVGVGGGLQPKEIKKEPVPSLIGGGDMQPLVQPGFGFQIQSPQPQPTLGFTPTPTPTPASIKTPTSNLSITGQTLGQSNLSPTSGFGFSSTMPTPVAFGITSASKPEPSSTLTISSKPTHPTPPQPQPAKTKTDAQQKEQSLIKSLPTTGLPSLEQVADLKRMVEEKRAQGGFQDVKEAGEGEEEDVDIEELMLDLERFQKRLELFHKRRADMTERNTLLFDQVRKEYDQQVLSKLNVLEDFIKTLKETKEVQKQEVNGLKERVFSHFTELEYVRALLERSQDPKYQELIASQPLDAKTKQKLNKIEKLCQYVRNQTAECERFFKNLNQQNTGGLQEIYQTLSIHSKIIGRLARNINQLRSEIGWKKLPELETHRVFEIPTMGHNYYEKKPLVKAYSSGTRVSKTFSVPKVKAEETNQDKVTMDDLTAGLSLIKLSKLNDLEILRRYAGVERKPMKINAKKLESLKKVFADKVEIDLTQPDKHVTDTDNISLSSPNTARSRTLIDKLDDMTLPKMMNELNVEQHLPTTPKGVSKWETLSVSTPKTSSAAKSMTSPGFAGSSIIFGTPATAPSKPEASALFASQVVAPSSGSTFTPQPLFASPATTVAASIATSLPFGIQKQTSQTQPQSALAPKTTITAAAAVIPTPSITTISQIFGAPIVSSSVFPSMGTTATAKASGMSTPIFSAVPNVTAAVPTFAAPSFSTSIFGSAPDSTSLLGTPNTVAAAVPKTPPFGAPVSTPTPASVSTPTPFEAPVSTPTPASVSTPTPFEAPVSTPTPATVSTPTPVQASVSTPTTPAFAITSTSVTSPAPISFETKPVSFSRIPTTEAVLNTTTLAVTVVPTPSITTMSQNFGAPIVPSSAFPSMGTTATAKASSTSTPIFSPVPNVTGNSPTFVAPSLSTSIFGSAPDSASMFGSPKTTMPAAAAVAGDAVPKTTTPAFPVTSTSVASPAPISFGTKPVTFSSIPTAAAVPVGLFVTPSTAPSASSFSFTSSATTTGGFGAAFGASTPTKPAFGGTAAFGTTSPSFGASSTFGASPAFGSTTSSPFGSAFGASSPSSAGGIFGGAAAQQSAPSFGSLAQSTPTTSLFGPSSFGSSGGTSVFGSTTVQSSAPVFGASPAAKPAFGSAPVFGSPTPTFGGSAPFGTSVGFGSSSSPFGSAFGASSPGPGDTGTTGSIFGGGAVQQNAPSFGTLAQSAPSPAGFGSFSAGGSVFGGSVQPTGFGVGQQQQASTPSFGGSAFSSWR